MQGEELTHEVEQGSIGSVSEAEQGEQYVCPVCGKSFPSPQSLRGHMVAHRREKREGVGVGGGSSGVEAEELEKTGAKPGEAGAPPPPLPPPPEVEIIDKAIEFLRERLPQVYGIEKYDRIVINALRDDPRPLINPNLLHAFIKSIAPRAHDSHLSVHVINPLYARFPNLPQAVVKYFESSQPHQYAMYMGAPPGYTLHQPLYYPPYHQVSQYLYPHFTPPYTYPAPLSPPYYPPPMPRRTYKVVVDGQEVETDESGYMAWQRFLREREESERRRQEHEMMMKKLEIEIKKALEEGGGRREDELNKRIEEISRKLDEERERRHQAELELLKREIDELKKRPSLLEELSIYEHIAERLGFKKGGRTTIDLLESFVERLDQRAAQILSKVPAPGSEWRPEIKRTPEERARKAEEIMKRLEKSEEVLKLEEELIKAAAKIKPRGGQAGETAKST
ncbi:MAG: C2H2-type zinc finger protein [Desulfurococcaceae archaeon]